MRVDLACDAVEGAAREDRDDERAGRDRRRRVVRDVDLHGFLRKDRSGRTDRVDSWTTCLRLRAPKARPSGTRRMSDAYARAGVDIAAGNQAVQRYRDVTSEWTHPDQLGALGGFSGLFRLPGRRQARAGRLDRRRRHEDPDRRGDAALRHGRRRSGQPLRQRHPRRPAPTRCSSSTTWRSASSTRTSRRSSSSGVHRACRANALRAARRRNRGDAGRLPARPLRPRRHDRRPRGPRRRPRSEPRGSRRCDRRAARGRLAHERLHARARADLRRRVRAAVRRHDVRRRAARAASVVPRAGARDSQGRRREVDGAHHRRRFARERAAHAARARGGGVRADALGRSADHGASWCGAATSRTRSATAR